MAKYPFLTRAVYELEDKAADMTGTDGRYFLFHAAGIIIEYIQAQSLIEDRYLHSILHCLYLHPFLAGRRRRELWDLACDIYIWSVERMLRGELGLRLESQGHPAALTQRDPQEMRMRVLSALREHIKVLSAQSIYRFFERNANTEWEEKYPAVELAELFQVDDHSMWYSAEEGQEWQQQQRQEQRKKEQQRQQEQHRNQQQEQRQDQQWERQQNRQQKQNQNQQQKQKQQQEQQAAVRETMAALTEKWGDIAEYAEAGLRLKLAETVLARGDRAGEFLESLQGIQREFEDYTSFLQKFAVLEERMQVDMDAFDFIYYTYGLELYHDVPLVEPLEYQERKAIHEFVIAIDTSGSCDIALVRRFLEKTFDILYTSTVFWGELRVYIIQCDAAVQQEVCITKLDELRQYMEYFEICGRGGTDFRPVFERVEVLRESGELADLRGLLYFTDGDGIFPARPTAYKTAFVFDRMDEKVSVPPWAMRIFIEDIADF